MNAATQPLDEHALRSFTPLCDLTEAQFQDLLARAETFTVSKNETLFSVGESDPRTIYLLSGELILLSANGAAESIRSTTPRARQPLAATTIRDCSATAKTGCTLLSIKTADLIAMTAPSATTSENRAVRLTSDTESLSDNEWLKDLLQRPAFGRLSPQQVESLSARVESVPVKAGQVIIKQGAAANNYYIIRSGRFQITRKIEDAEHPIELAILSGGSGFGEDALIMNGRRNASVTAIEDGALLRLSKHNFTTLIAQPLIQKVSLEQTEHLVRRGAVFLDVRSAEEFGRNGLANAVHIPVSLVRANLGTLKSGRDYIVYCNTGSISAVACFVLVQNGRRAFILNGGLDSLSANEDHHLGRATHHTPPSSQAKVIDVQKLSRRLAAATPVATAPSSQATSPASRPPVPDPVARQRDQAVAELAKLKAKLNNLASDEPTRPINLPPSAPQESPKSTATVASPGHFRDDEQLWTTIPGTANVPIDALRVTTPAGDSEKPAAAQAEPEHIELSWINDQHLWDTIIGYRSDPRVDALLAAESRRNVAAQPATPASTPQRPTETVVNSPQPPNPRSLRKWHQGGGVGNGKRRAKPRRIRWTVLATALSCAGGLAVWLHGKSNAVWLSLPLPSALSTFLWPTSNTATTKEVTPENTPPKAATANSAAPPAKRTAGSNSKGTATPAATSRSKAHSSSIAVTTEEPHAARITNTPAIPTPPIHSLQTDELESAPSNDTSSPSLEDSMHDNTSTPGEPQAPPMEETNVGSDDIRLQPMELDANDALKPAAQLHDNLESPQSETLPVTVPHADQDLSNTNELLPTTIINSNPTTSTASPAE